MTDKDVTIHPTAIIAQGARLGAGVSVGAFTTIGENVEIGDDIEIGEIVGGGQREDDHDTLLKRIKDHKLPIEPFQWYLDLPEFG